MEQMVTTIRMLRLINLLVIIYRGIRLIKTDTVLSERSTYLSRTF